MIRYVGGGYSGPREVHYLFIDGASLHGYLDNFAKRYLDGQPLEVDFRNLKQFFTKVFYYDAIPVRIEGESEGDYRSRTHSQRERHQNAANVDGVHVYEGDARLRRRKYEQKKVDVMIAVDLMHHTFRRNMHKATLLTGDGDFKPLLDAVVREGMEVSLWYPPGETSQELIDAADLRLPLNALHINSLLTSETHIPTVQEYDAHSRISGIQPIDGKRLRRWTRPGEDEQELWSVADGFLVVRRLPNQSGRYVRHRNLDLIKKICECHPAYFSLPDDLTTEIATDNRPSVQSERLR